MIDADSLIAERLQSAFPDWHVASEQDPGITFPAIIFAVSGDGQVGNGPKRWPLSLAVNILDDTETVFESVEAVYAEIRSWRGKTSPHGHVVLVADTSLISRVASTVVGNRSIQQYAGSFDVLART
ncbi:hypothetical protein ACFWHR_03885 [Leucobacter sp. NPDC058333]|uniref:hypothetical protein n=1 Tax=Leucobacter sp. NPDC058333 TaxID=3346450 RepID=UPI00364DA43F